MAVKDDYRELYDLIKQMDDMLKILEEIMDNTITETYHLPLTIKTPLEKITMEELEQKTDEQLEIFLKSFLDDETYNTFLTERESFPEAREAIYDIKRTIDEYQSTIKERDGMKKQADEAMEDYIKYVNSPEYKQRKREQLQKMREEAEKEENTFKRKSMLKKIEAIENSWSLSFLFERFNKLGESEVTAIKEAYFDNRKSSYILKKFEDKLKSSGYQKDSYKLLFNIEERFLPEEYRPFNNLYLFVIARFVAYADISSDIDKMYIQSIFLNTVNLVYHNFQSGEDENRMINIIKKVDDAFEIYRDFFKEYNSTNPDHPKRIQMDKEYAERTRILLTQKLTEENVPFDKDAPLDDLRKLYQDVVDGVYEERQDEEKKEVMEELKIKNQGSGVVYTDEISDSNVEEEPHKDIDEIDATKWINGKNLKFDNGDVFLVDTDTGEEYPISGTTDDVSFDNGNS